MGNANKATHVIKNAVGKRHPYCLKHYIQALRQCPLAPDERTVRPREHEVCEECEDGALSILPTFIELAEVI